MRREIEAIGAIFTLVFASFNSYAQEPDTLARQLTPFQKQSLRDYVEEFGDVLSVTELSNVDGFTPDEAAWLWDEASRLMSRDSSRWKGALTARAKKKYSQEGFSIMSKYLLESDSGFEAGVVVDNDPGEKFPDFVSAHVSHKGLVIGDYSARYGQGLVLWKATALNVMGEPASLLRRAPGISGYKSTDETNFLRGAAYSRTFGRFETSVFASYKKADAKSLDSCSVHEAVGGFNVGLKGRNWKIGLTAVGYTFDRLVKHTVRDDNRLRIYDGLWGNAGVDFMASLGHWRLFAEVACDAHPAFAALAGAIWSPDYNLEASLQLRAYSPEYTATHSMGSVYNDAGASVAVKYLHGNWKFNFNAQYDWYPWYRYNKPAGGQSYKFRIVAQRTFGSGALVLSQLTFGETFKMRLHAAVPLGQFSVAARAEANIAEMPQQVGHGYYVELSWKSQKLSAVARATYYNTDGWSTRIYFYEKNTPQSFGSEVYYGRGFGWYVLLKYSPSRRMDFCVKARQNYSVFFMRIFIPG